MCTTKELQIVDAEEIKETEHNHKDRGRHDPETDAKTGGMQAEEETDIYLASKHLPQNVIC